MCVKVEEFIDEPIQVEYDKKEFAPKAFVWRGQRHEVVQVVSQWQEWGTPKYEKHKRTWWQRRHRNYYVVLTDKGETLEIYLDRAGGKRDWVLLKKKSSANHARNRE